MKTIMTLAWKISRELARENGGSARSWLSAGLVLAWEQWKAEETLMVELKTTDFTSIYTIPDVKDVPDYYMKPGLYMYEGEIIEVDYTTEEEDEEMDAVIELFPELIEELPKWETPAFNIVRAWVKPTYRIHKNKAWKTVKFDEYQLEVLFKGQSVMVDYEVAKTDGLLSAVEKAGKEAVGEMKELLRELWLVVKPYKVQALARKQAIEELPSTPLADARPVKEPFSFKDTAKGRMYDVQFRGKTVSIVKAIVLKHGWRKAIEHAAAGSTSEQHKELLRGLWKAV